MNDTQKTTEQWYKDYYKNKGAERNALTNPQVLFQFLAGESAIIKALGKVIKMTVLPPHELKVLDVGCGCGGSLNIFTHFKFLEHNLFGIDIMPLRIEEAKSLRGGINFSVGDASKLDFVSESFDITFESTMFVQLTDDKLSALIASEMIRVTKTEGFIILEDWRYSKPYNTDYKGLSKYRIDCLFSNCEIIDTYNGKLIPPIGRFLSKYAFPLYFLITFLFPFLVGLKVTILRKK
jgi:ubiquinone/menaquinone biosynthesis C-methylase UbiE